MKVTRWLFRALPLCVGSISHLRVSLIVLRFTRFRGYHPPRPPVPTLAQTITTVLVVTRVTLTVSGSGAFVFRTPPLAVAGIPCIHTAPSSAAFAVPSTRLHSIARASTYSRVCVWCVLRRSGVLMAQRCVMAVGRGRDTVSRRFFFWWFRSFSGAG